MDKVFSFSQFSSLFPTDAECLEEIKKLRFPEGVFCLTCDTVTKHYRITGRTAYACKECRSQVFPLTGTIFAKSSTPLSLWFYAIYLMTQTRAVLSAKQLERELGVTYKTAWRMYTSIYKLMEMNKGDLLSEPVESTIRKWVFFNLEVKVVQKQESHDEK